MASVVAPSALWYLTRGTGAVTLVLLTVSVVLGVADVRRAHTEHVPRFVLDAIHRSASLLALALLAVHILTSVLDPFAPIRLVDAVIPFVSAYRPLWLGLGAVASDLLIAIALTSLLRHRFGYRTWRTTHWLAYACWPVALVHGFGTGSDARSLWLLALAAGATIVVLVAAGIRIAGGWPDHFGTRVFAAVASVATPIALLVWLPLGPLAPGWAKRAGTPTSLLASKPAASRPSTSSAGVGVTTPTAFRTSVTGTVAQSPLNDGLVRIQLHLALARQTLSTLNIRLDGQPIGDGGIEMTSSVVTLGTAAIPAVYSGQVTALEGTAIQAQLSGARGPLVVLAQLQIDQSRGVVTGTVTTKPATRG